MDGIASGVLGLPYVGFRTVWGTMLKSIPLSNLYTALPSDVEAGPARRAASSSSSTRKIPLLCRPRWYLGIVGAVCVMLVVGWNGSKHLKPLYDSYRVKGIDAPVGEAMVPTPLTSAVDGTAEKSKETGSMAAVRVHYRKEDNLNARKPILSPDCPVPVIFTSDERSADVVVWNSDHGGDLSGERRLELRRERPWQILAVKGVESASNRETLEEHHKMVEGGKQEETFDWEMSYRLASEIPMSYAYALGLFFCTLTDLGDSYDYFRFDNIPLPWEQKRQDRLVSAFVSNCHPKNARTLILQELQALLPGQLDSFGSCQSSASANEVLKKLGRWEQTGKDHTWWNIKTTTTSMYKFSFALENSNEIDYVSEKYFQAMEVGSVPIHLGTPTFKSSFLPSPNAALWIGDYAPTLTNLSLYESRPPPELTAVEKAGLARLAKDIRHLGSEGGREEYEAMLAWKRDDQWKTSPFGKVVELERQPYGTDCRLAGLYRGQQWAKSPWRPEKDRPTEFAYMTTVEGNREMDWEEMANARAGKMEIDL